MADPKRHEVATWMEKARNDLGAAEHLLDREPPFAGVAVYHCQQAAEKALKAFLIEKDTAFSKTHDLAQLVAECASLDPDFATLAEAAAVLTPYATAFRYPTGQREPTRDETEHALALATSVVMHVSDRLAAAGN
jgi:HEPN domain-containing protein